MHVTELLPQGSQFTGLVFVRVCYQHKDAWDILSRNFRVLKEVEMQIRNGFQCIMTTGEQHTYIG